jgi:hypothetical protein
VCALTHLTPLQVKTVDTTVDPVQIHDLFTLKCPGTSWGKDQITHLEFTVEDSVPGRLNGDCGFFKQSNDGICPDYLIVREAFFPLSLCAS